VGGVLAVWFVRMGVLSSVIERREAVLNFGAETWTTIWTRT